MTQLSLLEIRPQNSQKPLQIPLKEEKMNNPSIQSQTTPEIVKTSRTRWTDEQWRKEYWRNTNEHPRELIRRAREREDGKIAILLDHILNGYHRDNRQRNGRRTEEDLITDGNWYLLCELAKMMREEK
jgi:hypothetical protein